MLHLRLGYFISVGCIVAILLANIILSLPDGKLHVVFCNVGQGDATYIRFPDGRDMLVDGGPDRSILACLGAYMPFWDRTIDLVVLSHPQKDHMAGLLQVLRRYTVKRFFHSDVGSVSDGYSELMSLIKTNHIQETYLTSSDQIYIGRTTLSVIWPTQNQLSKARIAGITASYPSSDKPEDSQAPRVLGEQSDVELNNYCVVFFLRYGSFDVLFPGDGDAHIQAGFDKMDLADNTVEVLKVPHHGSKTGMTADFIAWLQPRVAVLSVGKNSFGHPSKEALNLLGEYGTQIFRTDKYGTIEVISDGVHWNVATAGRPKNK